MNAFRPLFASFSSVLSDASRRAFCSLTLVPALLVGSTFFCPGFATGQTVVYRPAVPMFAPAAGPYTANYTPSGNYAAVTAFSPPVYAGMPTAVVSTPVAAVVPSSSVAVTSYMAPAMTQVARPVTAYYAPSYAPSYAQSYGQTTTAFYGGEVAPMAVMGESYAAPATYTQTTTYYAPAPVPVVPVAPAAVVVPMRRGLFGGLRPMRGAYWPAY